MDSPHSRGLSIKDFIHEQILNGHTDNDTCYIAHTESEHD